VIDVVVIFLFTVMDTVVDRCMMVTLKRLVGRRSTDNSIESKFQAKKSPLKSGLVGSLKGYQKCIMSALLARMRCFMSVDETLGVRAR
jgi:hypothetical protein